MYTILVLALVVVSLVALGAAVTATDAAAGRLRWRARWRAAAFDRDAAAERADALAADLEVARHEAAGAREALAEAARQHGAESRRLAMLLAARDRQRADVGDLIDRAALRLRGG